MGCNSELSYSWALMSLHSSGQSCKHAGPLMHERKPAGDECSHPSPTAASSDLLLLPTQYTAQLFFSVLPSHIHHVVPVPQMKCFTGRKKLQNHQPTSTRHPMHRISPIFQIPQSLIIPRECVTWWSAVLYNFPILWTKIGWKALMRG